MCLFKKKIEQNREDFFLYLCEDYFRGSCGGELDYEEIINSAANEILPDVDELLDKEQDLTVDEVCMICRRLAVKTLLSIFIEEDKYLKILQEKYPKELKKLLENS